MQGDDTVEPASRGPSDEVRGARIQARWAAFAAIAAALIAGIVPQVWSKLFPPTRRPHRV